MYELVEGFICKSTIIKRVINAATGVSTLLGCISTRCWSIAWGFATIRIRTQEQCLAMMLAGIPIYSKGVL